MVFPSRSLSLARHSGEGRNPALSLLPSFRRKPGSQQTEPIIQLFSFGVIPAQAGNHFDLLWKCRASTRPAVERGTFFACAKKVTKESTPQAARSPGILPSEFARALRGSLNAHPCAYNELARIVRATLRACPPHTRRAAWGPFRAASCRRSRSKSPHVHGRGTLGRQLAASWMPSVWANKPQDASHRNPALSCN
jgi:hypothetical protein